MGISTIMDLILDNYHEVFCKNKLEPIGFINFFLILSLFYQKIFICLSIISFNLLLTQSISIKFSINFTFFLCFLHNFFNWKSYFISKNDWLLVFKFNFVYPFFLLFLPLLLMLLQNFFCELKLLDLCEVVLYMIHLNNY